jgi:regulator of nonsense transcripts 1
MLLVAPTTFASSALVRINYFADVIAIDEAAQVTDPDAVNVLIDQTKVKLVILAGDIDQLPPVVKSLQARSNPWATILVVSMMQRLLGAYPDVSTFELTRNYRAHPQLVHMAAKIFFERKMNAHLHPAGHWDSRLDRIVRGLLGNSRIFPRDCRRIKDHRQIFYAYEGLPVPEVDGTSLTNPTGVKCVVQKTRMLLKAGVRPEQVGIITFFKEDRRCIREALADMDINVDVDVETSTVEAFQGREKEIVLIHFVVASDDEENPFRFVSNLNRLCVATTRAKRFQFMFGGWAITAVLSLVFSSTMSFLSFHTLTS